MLAVLRWAPTYYRDPDGRPTTEVAKLKRSLAPLHRLFGRTPAAQFDPLCLEPVRADVVARGWCRTLVNRRLDRVKRSFEWAAARQLVDVTVYAALRTVEGLKKGRTDARESRLVAPADPARVAAVLPALNPHVRAMVELLRLTGMRPGEACRLCWVKWTGGVWVYRPARHKTAHRGKQRVIPLGHARADTTEIYAERDLALAARVAAELGCADRAGQRPAGSVPTPVGHPPATVGWRSSRCASLARRAAHGCQDGVKRAGGGV